MNTLERFQVDYVMTMPDGDSVETYAQDICHEQTVEIPAEVVPDKVKELGVVGQIESITALGNNRQFLVTISYLSTITAYSIPQFLNTLFGNISLKNNIRICDVRLSKSLETVFPGPTFGLDGIRRLLGVTDRPLTCTALKPVGLSADELADMAYAFASGGTDIIKDDHGMTNQCFAPFEERVSRVQAAIEKANQERGRRTTLYCPMINDEPDRMYKQLVFCKENGIKGVLAAPMLIGPAVFASMAKLREFVLMAHPAFAGTFFHDAKHGTTPGFMLGKLFRWLGADISVFPNAGGRFLFSQSECNELALALRSPDSPYRSAFPAPAGGMKLERIPEMIEAYGKDMVLIIGGNLREGQEGLEASTREFALKVQSIG